MPVVFGDFSGEALELLKAPVPSEIKCRNSVSRAYYGLYHSALAYADSVALPPVSATCGRTHDKLRTFYFKDMSADIDVRLKRRRVGYLLKVLSEMRCKADYELDKTISHMEAEAHYDQCLTAIGVIKMLEAAKAA